MSTKMMMGLVLVFVMSCASGDEIGNESRLIVPSVQKYNAFLQSRGLGLLQTYGLDQDQPMPKYFGAQLGWDQISQPTMMTLEEMAGYRLLDNQCGAGMLCRRGETCEMDEWGYICVPTECWNDQDCPEEYECWSGRCHIKPDEIMPSIGCPTSDGYTGVSCSMEQSAAGFAQCCGWCGCDSTGCQYDCADSDDCPGQHVPGDPEFPYLEP